MNVTDTVAADKVVPAVEIQVAVLASANRTAEVAIDLFKSTVSRLDSGRVVNLLG